MQKNYIKPKFELFEVSAGKPLAGSNDRPGGSIDDFTWDDGEDTGSGAKSDLNGFTWE